MKMRIRTAAICCSALIASLYFEADVFAQAQDGEKQNVGAEVYTEPRIKKVEYPDFPRNERRKELDGWVHVQMMVGPDGKPYEPEIVSSTGSPAFEAAALETIQSMKFEPATLGGKPIDAAITIPFSFTMRDGSALSAEFKKSYDAVSKALGAGDRQVADSEMQKLDPQNRFENAFVGLAQYSYASQWEGEERQLLALRRAVSGSPLQRSLPRESLIAALYALFPLEVRARDYSAALQTWKRLKIEKLDAERLSKLQPIAERIEALRSEPTPYSVTGSMPNGTWTYPLFRNKFRIIVDRGRISQIKLYCARKFVLFPFDPQLEYTVDKKFGQCSMIALGDADTTLKLIQ